jgi:class 3 adenylate cyclase
MATDPLPESTASPIERRLATILMADVAGYSRMMGEDEEQTVQTLRGHREIFDGLLKAHRGRIFNTAGDAILAEFPSAVEAVRCATEIQTALRTRNDHLPAEQRMWFRIGINLGDVIVQGSDLLGDGVNVAARIQSVADPGGACISGSVYDQIQNKLTLQIRQLGEKTFKNIAQPVRTFSISDESDGSPRGGMGRWSRSRSGPIAATTIGVIALLAVAGTGYWFYRDHAARVAEEARRAAEAQRVAEGQRQTEQQKAAATIAEKEARLLAELQSARDALTQAEASKRKAEQERVAAETAQREAKLQGELKAAKDALQKAAVSEKKADEERKAAAAAMRVAETAVQKAPEPAAEPQAKAEAKPEAKPIAVAAAPTPPATSQGIERFDGRYPGRICTQAAIDSTELRCWPVELTVKSGELKGSWLNQMSGRQVYAKGKIATDGRVETSVDTYNAKGRPMSATLKGAWSDDTIMVSGAWLNALPARGSWTRAK